MQRVEQGKQRVQQAAGRLLAAAWHGSHDQACCVRTRSIMVVGRTISSTTIVALCQWLCVWYTCVRALDGGGAGQDGAERNEIAWLVHVRCRRTKRGTVRASACIGSFQPKHSDWTTIVAKAPALAAVRTTCNAAAEPRKPLAPLGYSQTERSSAAQEAWVRVEYKRWHASEIYRLAREAKDQRSDFEEPLQQPLGSSSPSGEWSDYEQIKLEFSTKLRGKVSSAKLGQWTVYKRPR